MHVNLVDRCASGVTFEGLVVTPHEGFVTPRELAFKGKGKAHEEGKSPVEWFLSRRFATFIQAS